MKLKILLLLTLLIISIACDDHQVESFKEKNPTLHYLFLILFITPPIIQAIYLFWASLKNKFHDNKSLSSIFIYLIYASSFPLNIVGTNSFINLSESKNSLESSLVEDGIFFYFIGLVVQFIFFLIIKNKFIDPETNKIDGIVN